MLHIKTIFGIILVTTRKNFLLRNMFQLDTFFPDTLYKNRKVTLEKVTRAAKMRINISLAIDFIDQKIYENLNAKRSEESENTNMNNDIISAKRQTVYDSFFALKKTKIDHDKIYKSLFYKILSSREILA